MAEPARTPPPAPGPAVDPYVATLVRIIRAIDARERAEAEGREEVGEDGQATPGPPGSVVVDVARDDKDVESASRRAGPGSP